MRLTTKQLIALVTLLAGGGAGAVELRVAVGRTEEKVIAIDKRVERIENEIDNSRRVSAR